MVSTTIRKDLPMNPRTAVSQSEVGSGKWEVGSRKWEVGSGRSEVGSRKSGPTGPSASSFPRSAFRLPTFSHVPTSAFRGQVPLVGPRFLKPQASGLKPSSKIGLLLPIAYCLLPILSALAGAPGAVGDLYVSSGSSVLQYDKDTGSLVGTFASGGGLGEAEGLEFGPTGNLFVASKSSDAVIEYDGTSGTLIGTFASGGGLNDPWGLGFGSNGNLFVASMWTDSVIEYDGASGAPLGTFASGGGLGYPTGLTFGPNDNLFVSSYSSASVIEYDGLDGALIGTFASGGGLSDPRGLVFGLGGNLFVVSNDTNSVIEFDGASGALVGTFASGGGLDAPEGLAFRPGGNLFVASSGSGEVIEYHGLTGALVGTFASGAGSPAYLVFKPMPTYPAPDVTGFAPAQADNCGMLVGATITGTGLVSGAQLKLTRAGEADIPGLVTGVVPETQITADFDLTGAALGFWDLVLTYPDAQTDTLLDALDITQCPPPTVTDFQPMTADNCGVLVGATITGTDFLPGATVKLTRAGEADIVGINVDVQSSTTIVADFWITTGTILGFWDAVVTNPGGSGTLVDALEVIACPPPVVTGFDPAQAEKCGLLAGATISGSDFLPGATVKLTRAGEADIVGINVDVQSSTTIVADFWITTGTILGFWDAVVTNPAPSGSGTLFGALEVLTCTAPQPGAVGDIYCSSGDSIKQFDGVTLELVGTFSDSDDVGSTPRGLTFGPNGNLFAARSDVLELNGASGDLVRVFAEVGSSPYGLAFGPNGNLFVACAGTDDVREFDGATGAFVGVFASGGGLVHPYALAFGGPNGNLFVTSQPVDPISAPGDILEFDGSTGAFVGVFAAGVAPDMCPSPPCNEYNSFSVLYSLTFGPGGNLFVGVGHNSISQGAKLVELDGASGAVIQEFGQGIARLPFGLAFGPSGHLVVAERSDNFLFEFEVTTYTLVNSVSVSSPYALTFKPPCPPITPVIGGLSPAQADNCGVLLGAVITGTGLAPGCTEVRLIRAGEPDVVGIVSGGIALDSIEVDFLFDGDATGWWDLRVTYPADGQFDTLASALELVQTVPCPAPQATGFDPDLAVNCSELLDAAISGIGFHPSYTFGAVATLTKAGEPAIVGSNVEVQSDTLITADFDLTGAAAGLWDVQVTAPDGTHGTTLAGGLEVATCLFGVEGDIYVSAWNDGKVIQYDARTGQLVGEFVERGSGGLSHPQGLAFGGPAGNLFVVSYEYSGADAILEYDGATGALVGTFAAGGLDRLRGLTFGPNGNLFVCEQRGAGAAGGAVLEFDAATGSPLGAFASATTGDQFYGLTFGPSGNLFVTTSSPGAVLEFDGTTGDLIGTFAVWPGFDLPYDLTFGPDGTLYVSDNEADVVVEFDGTTGELIGVFDSVPNAIGLTFSPNGNLLAVTSARDGWISEYDVASGAFVRRIDYPSDPYYRSLHKARYLTVKRFAGTFPTPTLAAMAPVTVENCGALTGAMVTGTNLVWGGQLRLTRAGEADLFASSVEFVSDTEVTLNWGLTAAALGLWDLEVTYPDGQTATLADAIDITLCPPPVVTGLAPGQVDNCGPLLGATITGSGFLDGSTLTLSQAGEADIVGSNVDVQSDTSIVADFDVTMAAPGAWDLEVTHPGGSNSGSLANALTLTACPPPVVTEFSPLSADNCNWLVGATITGEWFTPGMTAVLSMAGEADVPGVNVDVQSLTAIGVNFNLTGAPPGLWDLTVTRPDQQAAALPAAIEVRACDPQCRPFGNPEFAAGYAPTHLAYGDLDDDGDLDLVVSTAPPMGQDNAIIVLLSDGAGTFAGVAYTVGFNPVSARLGDLDGDGDLDLAVANSLGSCETGCDRDEVSILFNNGDGTFGGHTFYPVAGTLPMGAAAGDLDGDGDLDLAITHRSPHGVHILLNNGDGTFAPGADHAVSSFAFEVTTGDLDGDGDLDLAVAGFTQGGGGLDILLNSGDATFGPAYNYPGCSCEFPGGYFLALGDLDGDDDLDAVLGLTGEDAVAVFFNNGNGLFGNIVSYPVGIAPPDGYGGAGSPMGVALGDLDGDGDLDLVVANDADRNVSVLLNDGLGSLAPQVMYEAGVYPWGLAIAPMDGDQAPDIVVANQGSRTISLLANNGDGTFHSDVRYPAGDRPWSVGAGDLDNDGDPDLAVVNYGSDDVSILLGAGDGTYAAPLNFPVGGEPRSVAVGDWDEDGALDLAVTNSASGEDDLSVLLNNGDGTFAGQVQFPVGGIRPWAVSAGDLDADGHLDLVSANWPNVSVLLGGGDGTFAEAVAYNIGGGNDTPKAVAIADLDGDGDLDLAVGMRSSGAVVLLNNGDGTFVEAGTYGVGYTPFSLISLASADFDDDGDFDLVLTGTGSTSGLLPEGVIAVLLNNGDATFSNPVTVVRDIFAGSVAIDDMDADGMLDLIVANAPTVSVIPGAGDGTFLFSADMQYGVGASPVGDSPRGLAVDDLDGDGLPDVAVANYAYGLDAVHHSVSVLLNRLSCPRPCDAFGDFDGDEQVGPSDVGPFVAVLVGTDTDPLHLCIADVNDDGAANGADIDLFVDYALNGLPPATSGACCLPTGNCVEGVTATFCTDWLNGAYQGDGTDCGSVCLPGACCLPGGGCLETTQFACESVRAGQYNGDGSTCATSCPVGACCLPDGTCVEISQFACETIQLGQFQGVGTTCAADCPTGACCLPNGTCTETNQFACTATLLGLFEGASTTCVTDCPAGACCLPNGACTETTQFACTTTLLGLFEGASTTCPAGCPVFPPPVITQVFLSPDPVDNCPDPIATIVSATAIFGTDFVDGATAKLVQAGQPDVPGFNVFFSDPTFMTADFNLGGAATGAWNVVVVNPDSQESNPSPETVTVTACTLGACCFTGPSCVDGFDEPNCTLSSGTFQGVGTTCAGVSCP